MAKRRTWKRDNRGRFASTGSSAATRKGDGPLTRVRARRASAGRQHLRAEAASEKRYVRDTGDVGTKKDQARRQARRARVRAGVKKLDAKVARARSKKRKR